MHKRTVFKMLDKASVKYATKPYLSQKGDSDWERVTFSEAKKKVFILASALIELGVTYEDKIAILSEAKNDWILSELAMLYSGGISVPLSIKLLPEEVTTRINHSDSSIFIISENTLEKVISQIENYTIKDLKIIVLNNSSDKINNLCKKFNFDEKRLIFIDKLYALGEEKLENNLTKIENIVEQINEDDVVTISYTSGTTGNPKGIMLTHLNYYSNSHEAVKTFHIKEFISTLIILPADHSFAHTVGIYTAMVKGLSLHFVDARGGSMNALKNIPTNLVEANSNFLLTVPALTSNFIQKIKEGIQAKGAFIEGIFNRGLKAGVLRNGDGFSKPGMATQITTYFNFALAELLIFKKLRLIWGNKIEFFVGGGALLDIKQQQFYQAIGVPVYQGYGLTEATPIISTNTPYHHKMGTSGKVLGNIKIKICDENGKELPKGEKGEIVIKGDNVMKGYYKNPQATAETIKNGWLYTGDLGFMDQDDFLVVVGREKALLISDDGEKYSPEEIEEAIVNSSSFINQIMIYNDHKKYTSALITLNKSIVTAWIRSKAVQSGDEILNKIKTEVQLFSMQPEFEGKFPSKWIPSIFQIIQQDFSEENKMINSTLKMVRRNITDTYQTKLDLMYDKQAQKSAEKENIIALSKIFPLSTN